MDCGKIGSFYSQNGILALLTSLRKRTEEETRLRKDYHPFSKVLQKTNQIQTNFVFVDSLAFSSFMDIFWIYRG